MPAQSFQILLIGEDPTRTQAYAQMLQDAEDVHFDIQNEAKWLSQFASSAPHLPLPHAILWELPASGAAAWAFVKDMTSKLPCLPLVALVSENQKKLGRQMLEAGASEYLVMETLSKELLQRVLRYAIERRHLESLFRQSHKGEAIGRLSGGFAHDFNNLLTVINGHTEILTEALQPGDPAVRSVRQIRNAADSAAALIRQWLAFNRLQVFLPQRVNPGDETPGENKKGTETILVVEDAESLRALTKEFLTASGYTVLEAANGEEAIQIAQSHYGSIDLLLTDVVMPRMGAKPLVEQMAQIRPHTRVLYMSGYPSDGIVQAGVPTNGATLLEKPFTREILSKRVRQALDVPAQAT